MLFGEIDYLASELGVGIAISKKLGREYDLVPLKNKIIKESGLYIIFNKNIVELATVQAFSNKLAAFKQTKDYQALVDKYLK